MLIFLYDMGKNNLQNMIFLESTTVGIDVGIKDFAVLLQEKN